MIRKLTGGSAGYLGGWSLVTKAASGGYLTALFVSAPNSTFAYKAFGRWPGTRRALHPEPRTREAYGRVRICRRNDPTGSLTCALKNWDRSAFPGASLYS